MKNTLTALFILFFGINMLFAQTEDEIVKKIRDQFTQINSNLKTYKTVEKEVFESTEGGSVKGYYDNGTLVSIHYEVFGEMGGLKEDYYFSNGKLFFVYSLTQNYSAPVYVEGSTVSSSTEQRYYLDNEKLIRWLNNEKKKVDKNLNTFKESEEMVLNDSKKLQKMLNEK